MSVATRFYRLKAEAISALEANPELMDWLLGCSETVAESEKLGFQNGIAPPHLNIGQAWDDILTILCRTGNEKACQTLDVPVWEEFDGFEEIRLFYPPQVENGLAFLEKLELGALRAETLRQKLQTFDGEPFAARLDDVLEFLESLRVFWREAANAGEGFVSSTG